MEKITCTDKESGLFPDCLKTVLPGYVEGDTEVVMVMSLEMAKRLLSWQTKNEGGVKPISQMDLQHARSLPSWHLELPRLEMRPDEAIRIEDGRHRVALLCDLEIEVIPFLTYERVAMHRPHRWGSVATANSLYDFSACQPRKLIGSP
jgi:hypothetical protein